MRKTLRDDHDEWEEWDADLESDRQTKALAALALILALALLGCYLILQLRSVGHVEDCLLAQHTDCDSLIDQR